MRQSYLREGGSNPAILRQIAQMEAEAGNMEGKALKQKHKRHKLKGIPFFTGLNFKYTYKPYMKDLIKILCRYQAMCTEGPTWRWSHTNTVQVEVFFWKYDALPFNTVLCLIQIFNYGKYMMLWNRGWSWWGVKKSKEKYMYCELVTLSLLYLFKSWITLDNSLLRFSLHFICVNIIYMCIGV